MELAGKLKEHTSVVHRQTENSFFMKCFIRGMLEREEYVRLLASLWPLYESLEDAMRRNRTHRIAGKLYFRELERLQNLEEDLQYLMGSRWKEIPVPEASKTYAKRLRELMIDHPHRLVAHAYVRYLGDLSGGQILKKIASKTLGLDRQGLRFYHFDGIVDADTFKTSYRARLDSLPVSEEEEKDILEEALLSFEMNGHIFQELEGPVRLRLGPKAATLETAGA